MSRAIDLDKPGHIAATFLIRGERVCVLTPAAAIEPRVQAQVRRLLKGLGTDCRSCRGCPVGTAE